MLCLLVVEFSEQVQHCPSSEFEIYNGACYSFHGRISKNWQGARDACKAKGLTADLVSIHSEAENTYIYNQMKPLTYDVYWIGMRKDQKGKEIYHRAFPLNTPDIMMIFIAWPLALSWLQSPRYRNVF